MRLIARFGATIACAGMACSGIAMAQGAGGPECGTFTVYYDPQSREYVDHGAEGPSTGDQRISMGHLLDEEGNQVGVVDIVTTVLTAPEGEDQAILAIFYHAFDNGSLTSVARTVIPNASDLNRGTPANPERPITGGSGDFAHATGTVTSVHNPDGLRGLTFNLICHD